MAEHDYGRPCAPPARPADPAPFWRRSPVAVFGDGGVIQKNPSPIGGTWAWCAVTADGTHTREASGYVLPSAHPHPGWPRVPRPDVSNNHVEFYAILRALESLPDDWQGRVATDSQVTVTRFGHLADWRSGPPPYLPTQLPPDWQERARAALRRLPLIRWTPVAGHPTQVDLGRGFAWREEVDVDPATGGELRTKTKVLVSRHQVWCDDRCTLLAHAHETALAVPSWYAMTHPEGDLVLPVQQPPLLAVEEAA